MKSVSSTVHLSPNALKVLEKRYLKKNEEGIVVEKAENLFRRIAKTIASADLKYGKSETETAVTEEEFYAMITSLDFLPNSPTLMNAGRRLKTQWNPSSTQLKTQPSFINPAGAQGSVFRTSGQAVILSGQQKAYHRALYLL